MVKIVKTYVGKCIDCDTNLQMLSADEAKSTNVKCPLCDKEITLKPNWSVVNENK